MHDVVVLSDLHLGRGKNPATGRYHSLETFFYDEDFRHFCRHLSDDAKARDVRVKLVLNGDTFDFLRIEPEQPPPGAPLGARRFGAALTPTSAARMIRAIVAGHPVFFDGLARFLQDGHDVVFLPGNHDVEIQWEPVHDVVRQALLDRVRRDAGDEVAADASTRLRFEPWFEHEPGRIWIEHGNQYDPECAFRYPLRGGLLEESDALHRSELDLPLGNFFQRYLYNGFGPITFIVPSTRANFRYFKWLLFNEPRLLFRVLRSHLPFSVQVLRRMSKLAGKRRQFQEAHSRQLEDLAARTGLGEKLVEIDKQKNMKTDLTRAVSQIVWQFSKLSVAIVVFALLAAGLWFAGFQAINELRLGFWPKALLFLALNFLFLVAGTVSLFYTLRSPPAVEPRPLLQAAERISSLLGVRFVSFGHTHEEVLWPLPCRGGRGSGGGGGPDETGGGSGGGGADGGRDDTGGGEDGGGGRCWYYNTGTWISVFTHDVLYPRERVQFTFLRVRENEGELLHWSPGREEALPVVLLEEQGPSRATLPPSA